MLEKLKRLQYGARIRLYSADQMQVISVAGRRTQLLRGGKGRPLVYLHSIVGETIWLPFHQGLSREFEVIAPASPGFAMSEDAEGSDDIEDVVFHYLDLFAELGLERFHLVGASLGGWIAAEFALRYPERIDHLVLANACGLWLDEPPAPATSLNDQDVATLRQSMLADPTSFLGELLFPEDNSIERIGGEVRTSSKGIWSRSLHSARLHARLHRITAPTLVLWGANDSLYPPRYAQAFHEVIAGSKVQLIEKCGHLPMFEQEPKFVAAVARFLHGD